MLRSLNYYKNSINCMRELSQFDKSEELCDKLRQTERMVFCIETALAMLTDEERYIIDKMFIRAEDEPTTVDELCEQCICEKSSIYRIRKRALDKFTMSVYGDI